MYNIWSRKGGVWQLQRRKFGNSTLTFHSWPGCMRLPTVDELIQRAQWGRFDYPALRWCAMQWIYGVSR